MSQFVNLFDKPMKLVFPDNSETLLPASDVPLILSFTESNQLLNGMPFTLRTPNTPLLVNMPDVIEGTIYLVPSWAAVVANRPDFVVAFAQALPDSSLLVKRLFRQE